MSRIVIVGTHPGYLVNMRGDLIRDLVKAGHAVTAMTGRASPADVQSIVALGAEFRSFPIQRNGLNPAADVKTWLALRRAFAELKPDLVLAYTVKPIIWGGLALRGVRNTRFAALITGLGFAFHGEGVWRRALTRLTSLLYRAALQRAFRVLFQNRDNEELFIARGLVDPAVCAIVNGSGVDLCRFTRQPLPSGEMVFLAVARLLGEKGLREYAEAAGIVRGRYPQARFWLVGPEDPSPDGIRLHEIRRWHDSGSIEYFGAADDVRPFLEQCSVFVFPSYHEGMPRAVLEAMAVGRPILTTDVPGCRDTVQEPSNGFLVPARDTVALASRMLWFMEHPDALGRMADSSRAMAEARFDVHRVNAEIMRLLEVVPAARSSR